MNSPYNFYRTESGFALRLLGCHFIKVGSHWGIWIGPFTVNNWR